MNNFSWVDENQKWITQYPDFIQLVGKQIHKDFSLEGLNIEYDVFDDLNRMYQKVYVQVTHFVQNDFNALMRLLYRIDISEEKVQRQMDLIPDDTARAISELILKREIQKVVLRKQFSVD
jgi:hypothetical protein